MLTLTEVRGFALRRDKQVGFAEINKLAPELSMEGVAFRLKMIYILKNLILKILILKILILKILILKV
jgi:hypothetical protein